MVPFSTELSTLLENILPFSSNLKFVVCKRFQFGTVENVSFGKGFKENKRTRGPDQQICKLVISFDNVSSKIKVMREHIYEPGSLKRRLNLSGNNIEAGQPARTPHAQIFCFTRHN